MPTIKAQPHQPTHTNTYRKLVEGTTINQRTLLSTDYLNHFNEFAMLLDMLLDVPDMLAELEQWRPKTYQEHFQDSGFAHKDLAIMAYENAPPEYKIPFDSVVLKIDALISEHLPLVKATLHNKEEEHAMREIQSFSARLTPLMDTASGIINGVIRDEHMPTQEVMDQGTIDSLFQ